MGSESKMKGTGENRRGRLRPDRRLLPAASLSLALCFLLLLYAPLEIYCNNYSEFWFSFALLFKTLLPFFLGAFLLLTAFSALVLRLGKKLYEWYLPAFAAAFLSTYVQGTFFAGNLPALDGNTVDWSKYAGQRTVTIVIWIVCLAAVILAWRLLGTKRWETVLNWGGCGMTLMLLLTLSVLCVTTGALQNRHIDLTTDNQMEFSRGKNYTILMMDAMDEDVLSHVLADHPEYETGVLKDFTHYDNALSGYSLTTFSLPSFLSGTWYEFEQPYKEWLSDSFRESRFLRGLQEQGYQLSFYSTNVPFDYYPELKNLYVAGDELNSRVKMEKLQLRLVGFRYAPFDLKPIFRFDTLDFDDTRSYAHMPYVFWHANARFNEAMDWLPATLQDENSFKFIHLDGAHVPFDTKIENGEIVSDSGSVDGYRETEVCLFLLEKYVGILKDLGIYDDTVIVMMSDHGQEPLAGLKEGENPLLRRADPVFLVKGFDDHRDRMLSLDTPISFIELPDAFLKLLDGASGSELFAPREDNYVRRFLLGDTDYSYEFLWEYEQSGPASDPDSLKATGRTFSR